MMCQWCYGTGQDQDDPLAQVRCPYCHGTGDEPPCPTCGLHDCQCDYEDRDDEEPAP